MGKEINEVESEKVIMFKPSARMGTTHWVCIWFFGILGYNIIVWKSTWAHVVANKGFTLDIFPSESIKFAPKLSLFLKLVGAALPMSSN